MKSVKICLDAGHAGKENRSPVVPAFYESDFNWKLHLKLKKELEHYGIQVITTRKNQDEELGTKSRGRLAAGCDLLLSIHSNAAERESADYPLAIVPVSGAGDGLGKRLADCVRNVMDTDEPAEMWSKKTDDGSDWYGIISGAAQVGVMAMILEHSFYTNKRMAAWMLEDANLDMLAKAEAAVIAEHFGVKDPEEILYVLTAFLTTDSKADAVNWQEELSAKGWSVSMKEELLEKAPPKAPVPSLDEIARAVINGDYGNGHTTREANLRAAGMLEHYTYQQIRQRVNELYK